MIKKTITVKSREVTNAYHKIMRVEVWPNHTNIYLETYDNADASSDENNKLEPTKQITLSGADHTTYFGTGNASENVFKRAESYLITKPTDYTGGTIV